jgi:hypothetical protein
MILAGGPETADTRLALTAEVRAYLGKSGMHDMGEPHNAFAARGLLANAAEKSIDAQRARPRNMNREIEAPKGHKYRIGLWCKLLACVVVTVLILWRLPLT